MSPRTHQVALTRVAIALTATIAVSGCAYDYLQTTDRVAYSAGDAVRANIERETTNPSSTNMNDVSRLGSNGNVTSGETAPTGEIPAPAMMP